MPENVKNQGRGGELLSHKSKRLAIAKENKAQNHNIKSEVPTLALEHKPQHCREDSAYLALATESRTTLGTAMCYILPCYKSVLRELTTGKQRERNNRRKAAGVDKSRMPCPLTSLLKLCLVKYFCAETAVE